MPEKEHRFTVKAKPEAVESLLWDLGKVYYLFPPFTSVEKVGDSFRWFLKGPLKLKAGSPYLEAVISKFEHGLIEWQAESPHLTWKGRFTWADVAEETEITVNLCISDTGPLGKVHEQLIGVQITNLVRYFERRVKEILEGAGWTNGLP